MKAEFSQFSILAIAATITALATTAHGHSGGTDSRGCHSGSQSYHCHTPKNNFQIPPKDDFQLTPKGQGAPQLFNSTDIVNPDYFRPDGVGIICPALRIEETKVILLSGDRFEAGIAQFNGEEVRYLKYQTIVSATVVGLVTNLEHWELNRKTARLEISSIFSGGKIQTLHCTIHTVGDAHQRATNMLDSLKQDRKF